jgi:hypothetical protein
MGELLKIDNTATVKIEGVLDDPPQSTDFPIGIVGSYETMKKYRLLTDIQIGGVMLQAVFRRLCSCKKCFCCYNQSTTPFF